MITFSNQKYAIYIILAGFIALLFFVIYSYMRRRILRAVTGMDHKKLMFINGSYSRLFIKELLTVFAVIFLTVAMLGPGWGEEEREKRSEGTDLLIALDVSMSMLAKDASPDRLTRAKNAIKLIAEGLDGDRIGLVVFAGDAFLLCPLTTDTGAFMMFLDSAGPDSVNVQGTDMGRMFGEALRVFKKKRLTSRMIVVITDGEDNEGSAEVTAGKLKDTGIAVYALGVGKDTGEYIQPGESGAYLRDSSGELIRTNSNPSLLKKIASGTGGTYSDITSGFSGIDGIIDAVKEQQKNSNGTRKVKEKKDRSWIFILLAVLCIGAEMAVSASGRSYEPEV